MVPPGASAKLTPLVVTPSVTAISVPTSHGGQGTSL
jgi:hypothetical protein